MSTPPRRILMRFRQDLRVYDNTALAAAADTGAEIIPIFIFDEGLLETFGIDARCGFLMDACQHLHDQLSAISSGLIIMRGEQHSLIPRLAAQRDCDAVYANRAYDHYGQHRDQTISSTLHREGREYCLFDDYLLSSPGSIAPYKVFTPYRKKTIPTLPDSYPLHEIDHIRSPREIIDQHAGKVPPLNAPTNRHRPIAAIRHRVDQLDLSTYDETRNTPSLDGTSDIAGTSQLSPYIRFGVVSIRHLYTIARPQSRAYTNELGRREFWYQILHHRPEARTTAFLPRRRQIPWENDRALFDARREGRTGYPIIDAAMRQLRETHRMHGRCRMVVASFLVKDLLIDRRWGEQHFRDYLIDYDEAVNIGNRQRSASVGADPKPLRIFNPLLQSSRYDPDGTYIKHRLPELRDTPASHLHAVDKHPLPYCTPIVNHRERTLHTKEVYNSIKAEYKKQQG